MPENTNQPNRQLFWWQQMAVRFRRLMREGLGEFLASMTLAVLAAILCSIYIRDKAALDRAMQDETVKIVGTRQEPVDSAQELGLIATALAKVNASDPRGWESPGTQPNWPSFEKLPGELVHNTYFTDAAIAHLDSDGEWENDSGDIATLVPRLIPRELSWPELGISPFCTIAPDHTFLMVPTQLSALKPPYFPPRIAAAADISKTLMDRLNGPKGLREDQKYEKLTESLV